MNWISGIFVTLLSGALGLLLTGLISSACVEWYHVSKMEGGAGYMVVFTSLFGALIALGIGLVVSLVVNAGPTPGFLKALGWSWGVLVAVALLAAGGLYLNADIPPRLDGGTLNLEVELRLPAGAADPTAARPEKSRFSLGSTVRHVQRKSVTGELRLAAARREEGRWVIPASAFLFTRRGYRSTDFVIDDGKPFGFLIPLPARPGRKYLEWSEWYPRPRRGDAPWPATEPSIRFRVQPVIPPPEPRDPDEIAAEAFAALKPDAPLEAWLAYLKYDAPEQRNAAVMAVVRGRPADLARQLASPDAERREPALLAVERLTEISPEIVEAVRAEGRAIADGIRSFNALPADQPDSMDIQIALRGRFNHWKTAWWTVAQRLGLDGRPPVQEIHDLAQVRARGTSMSEIELNARVILDALNAPGQ